MMIKITEKCSMHCKHCLNDATSCENHMDFHTFKKAIAFQKMYGGPFCIMTGGEPTEHPLFAYFIGFIMEELKDCFITVTTNGVWMQDNESFIRNMNEVYGVRLMFQVTNDERYYPTRINLSLPVFNLDNVVVCEEIAQIYPQGRALYNNLPWESKGSKCFNIRAITHQVEVKDLRIIIGMLAVKQKFCTPHIGIDGCIKLGESDLCPACSHIDKSHNEIIKDILEFRCDGCKHVNDSLPQEYRKIIGEP